MVANKEFCRKLGIKFNTRQAGHYLMQYFRYIIDRYQYTHVVQEECRDLINIMSYRQQILFVYTYYETECVKWMVREVLAGRIKNLPESTNRKNHVANMIKDYEDIKDRRSKSDKRTNTVARKKRKHSHADIGEQVKQDRRVEYSDISNDK